MPALVPICDVLSTVPYLPADAMALLLGGERSFKAFANRARLPAILKAGVETVEVVNQHWWLFR
ncbi:hypothetical protein ABIE78_002768 [Sinorhizobium fredii]|uniref:Uncharacterized protein n=1 Tax=Sinorhizobium fredii (strain USDA 257) TaxID=1185652 RepID=I3X697_SINF2|nr:hypothetical protein USDA257_c28320 [Sinorhizobium fredii USDA 257]